MMVFNIDSSLYTIINEHHKRYSNAEQGGPLLFMLLMQDLFFVAKKTSSTLHSLLKKFRIDAFPGENIKGVTTTVMSVQTVEPPTVTEDTSTAAAHLWDTLRTAGYEQHQCLQDSSDDLLPPDSFLESPDQNEPIVQTVEPPTIAETPDVPPWTHLSLLFKTLLLPSSQTNYLTQQPCR
jgi:hypothetical protein